MHFVSNSDKPTRPSLILQLRDAGNAEAWGQFVDVYTPLVYGYCRNRGLQDADAADVAQDVMRAVANAMVKFEYDPERGRFRGWLLTVTRSKINNYFAKRHRHPIPEGGTAALQQLEAHPAPDKPDEWELLYQRRMFEWAADQVRPEFKESTWQAFWRTAVADEGAKTVAENLGLSVGAIYIAKSRVLARLRKRIQAIDPESVSDFEGGL